jgi:hypothetical protein
MKPAAQMALTLRGRVITRCFTNTGFTLVNFNEFNSVPHVKCDTVDLRSGTIAVGYKGDYVSAGFHPFITASTPISPNDVGNYLLPRSDHYVKSWQIKVVDNQIGVEVERVGFGEAAISDLGKRVGMQLDRLGTGNPPAVIFRILNNLQKVKDPEQLDRELTDLATRIPDFSRLNRASL